MYGFLEGSIGAPPWWGGRFGYDGGNWEGIWDGGGKSWSNLPGLPGVWNVPGVW